MSSRLMFLFSHYTWPCRRRPHDKIDTGQLYATLTGSKNQKPVAVIAQQPIRPG